MISSPYLVALSTVSTVISSVTNGDNLSFSFNVVIQLQLDSNPEPLSS